MDKKTLYSLHDIPVPPGYMSNPKAHLSNTRDKAHVDQVLTAVLYHCYTSWLDIGSWDGWLPFCVLDDYSDLTDVCMVEPIRSLSDASKRYISHHNLYNAQAITGWWLDDETDPMRSFDLVTCFECLEHVPLGEVPLFLEKMELFAKKEILISLPDQPCEQNPQHQWTPTEPLIQDLFADKWGNSLQIEYRGFDEENVPCNWFIRYRV
jgi:hypothetical protein